MVNLIMKRNPAPEGARKGYYIGQKNHFFETHGKKLYYYILFDNDNRAKKVVIGGQPGKD